MSRRNKRRTTVVRVVVQHDAERVNVDACAIRLALVDFGRHVGVGSGLCKLACRLVDVLCDAEVAELKSAVFRNKDVFGLNVTVDDAAGEAFDKVARTLGLPYPGGPSVSQAAKTGDPHYYKLPTPHVEGKYNVSFSGLKTAVVNEVHNAQQRGEEVRVADMAASFQERIAQILAKKLLAAAADTNAKTICLAGGVAANGRLRQLVNDGAQKLGAKVYLPELKYCGDNGAMIAAQGYYEFKDGNIADLTLNGLPTLAIDYR